MKPLVLVCLLLFSIISAAQKNEFGRVKGSVSTKDGQPAEYITVVIKNTSVGTITDDNGNFELKKIKPGSYTLIFSLSGNIEKEISVEARANDETILKIQVEHTFTELQGVIIESKQKYVETKPSPSLRLNYPLIETPQNIQITTRQLLLDQGLISMSEAIRTVSGIQKNYGEMNDITLNMRGIEGSFNVYRNGLGQYWWNQQDDIAMIEKIEFIKGTAGFIVSNFPPGGFINVVTKQPQREPVASVNIEYGSFNLFRLTTDWGGAFSKKSKFTYRFNAGLHKQDRAFQFSNATRYFVCGALKFEPTKKNVITAEYNYMWGKTSGNNTDVPSLNGRMFSLPRNFAVANAKTDNLIGSDNYFRLLATHQFNSNWSLSLLLGDIYGKWGQGYILRADGDVPVTNDTLYRYADFDDWRSFSRIAQLYLNGTFHTGKHIEHKIFSAIDYHSDGVTDPWGSTDSKFGLYIHAPDYYVNQDSLRNFSINHLDTLRSKNPSLYLEDHVKLNGKIILTLAGRFTHINNKFISDDIPDYQRQTYYDHFTPRIGLNWLFSEAMSAYAVYDQFFIPIYERNIERKPFKPVTGYNTETGLKGYFLDKRISAGVSLYHIVANNASSIDPSNPNYYIQLGQITHDGVDFDMTGNITPSLMINANYAYAHAWLSKGDSDKIGRKKVGTPDHCANLWLRYKIWKGKLNGFSFSLGYQYMGRRSALSYDEPGKNVYLPVYNLLDAAISYHREKFTIGLNVYNITNTEYATMGVFKPSNNEWRYTPGEPINFRVTFNVNLQALKRVRHSKRS